MNQTASSIAATPHLGLAFDGQHYFRSSTMVKAAPRPFSTPKPI
jgi:hypothetical protein